MGLFDSLFKKTDKDTVMKTAGNVLNEVHAIQQEKRAQEEKAKAAERELSFESEHAVPYCEIDRSIGLNMDVNLTYKGTCLIRITDQEKYRVHAGDSGQSQEAFCQLLTDQLHLAIQKALAVFSEKEISYTKISEKEQEFAELVSDRLQKQWEENPGVTLVSIRLEEVHASEESEKLIGQIRLMAELRDPAKMAEYLKKKQEEAERTLKAAGKLPPE